MSNPYQRLKTAANKFADEVLHRHPKATTDYKAEPNGKLGAIDGDALRTEILVADRLGFVIELQAKEGSRDITLRYLPKLPSRPYELY